MRRLKMFLVALSFVAGPLSADGVQMLLSTTPAAVGRGSIGCQATDTNNYGKFIATGQSLAYNIEVADATVVHVYSDAGSVATVDIETAPTSSGPWFPVTTSHITNPTAVGEPWSIVRQNWVRINVTAWASGNVRACISSYYGNKKVY